MPALPSPKNPLLILKNFRDEFETRTGLTNFDKDSKARAIADVFKEEILLARQETIDAFYANQISTAQGESLDQIGENLGLRRRQPSYASVNRTEQCLAFYVESGTFGAINAGAPIPLTVGTIIRSDADTNELNTTIDFTIQEAVTLAAGDTIGFVTAKATNIGSGSNVGAETLRSHNFTSYVDSAARSLKVINFFPILNGANRESDDNYRYRLSQFYLTLIQLNNSRIQLAGLAVAGVQQVQTLPGYYGIGTAAAAVMGAEFQTNNRMLSGVQAQLNSVTTPGLSTYAIPAEQVSFDFVIEAKPSRKLYTSEINRLKGEIRRSILNYFRTRTLGDLIDLEALALAVQTDTGSIVSLDAVGSRRRFFKKSWIRKGFAGGATDERQRLISRFYQLESREFAALGTLDINFI